MKHFITSVKNWFAGLWQVALDDLKKLVRFLNGLAAFVFVAGLMYFFYQIIIAGNLWQSMASFCIGASVAVIIISLAVMAGRNEDGMYEVAIADLQKQVTDAENNYDLMRQANQVMQKENDILLKDVERQAKIIADMATKNNKLFIELDMAKARLLRSNIGSSKIDPKGKIVE